MMPRAGHGLVAENEHQMQAHDSLLGRYACNRPREDLSAASHEKKRESDRAGGA